jgi:transforming growth factor-beta-induced protein
MKKLAAVWCLVIPLFALAGCQTVPAAAPAAPAPAATEVATEAMTEAASEAATEVMTDTAAAPAPVVDIVDTAVAAGNFSTLVAAVQAAGLVDTLKGDGPFTVFAPTDEAFAKLPASTLEALLKDPQGQLTQILLYHVIPGQVMAADVKDGLEADTVQGGKVKFSVADGVVKINDATVVATDIAASNGVIHVIDAVILPPAQ